MKIYTVVCGEIEENCYIADVGNGLAVAVDPGDGGERIYNIANEHDLKISAILLTHGHFDHIGGLVELYRLTGADVYIHGSDIEMLKYPQLNLSSTMSDKLISAEVPVKRISGGEVLTFGNTSFSVLHTPGHTQGCVCYDADDAVFTGDTVFSNGYGRTDFPGGSMLQLRNSIRMLKSTIAGKTIYPGHGETKIF